MLREQGVAPPPTLPGADPAYTTALWAVCCGGLTVGEFSAVFYNYLPAWDDQDEVQRRIVVLLHEWDQESDPEEAHRSRQRIREAASTATRYA